MQPRTSLFALTTWLILSGVLSSAEPTPSPPRCKVAVTYELLPDPVPGRWAHWHLSPDRRRFAWVVVDQGRATVVVDGRAESPHEEFLVRPEPLASKKDRVPYWSFSQDSRRFAYVVRDGWDFRTVTDGKPGPACQDIRSRPRQSPDRPSTAYLAKKDDRWGFAIDGPQGSTFRTWVPGESREVIPKSFRLTSDHQRFIYRVLTDASDAPDTGRSFRRRKSSVVICNGKEEGPYDRVDHFTLSRTGGHYAYAAWQQSRTSGGRASSSWAVFVDGKEVYRPDGSLTLSSFHLSPTGRHWLCVVARDDNSRSGRYSLVWDGVAVGQFHSIHAKSLVFSPDGEHFACPATVTKDYKDLRFMVHDGRPLGPFKGVGATVFSPDSSRLAFGATDLHGSGVVCVDGKTSHPYQYVGPPVFSPDSRRLAFYARKHGKELVVVDGVDGRPENKVLRDSALLGRSGVSFSPDSRHVVYLTEGASYRDPATVVLDGKTAFTLPVEEDAWNWVGFSPDSRHILTLLSRHENQLWVNGSPVTTEQGLSLFYRDNPVLSIVGEKEGEYSCLVDPRKGHVARAIIRIEQSPGEGTPVVSRTSGPP